MKKEFKAIPKFKNEDEEREFWATADSSEYFDWSKAEKAIFPNLKPSRKSISIRLPEYFEALTRNEGRTIQLTAKGKEPYLLSATEILDGKFEVFGNKPDGGFYWEVKAVRADIPLLVPEKPK